MLVWVWLRRDRRVVFPFDHTDARRGRGWYGLINLAESLPALLLGLVIIILAGPLQLSEPKTKRKLTNIQFCVDISGSMTAKFGDGSRYDASMKAINQFLDYRDGDAFGLTFFGNNYLHWVPLTTDVSAFRCAPPFMRPESAPPWFGGTEIGKALLACRKVLVEREKGDRMIVLVSDGSSSDLGGGADAEIAAKMRQDNIVVYGVHIASGSIPDPVVNITVATGGEAFMPDDTAALDRIFQRIDEMQLAQLERASAESMDHFFPYCMTGLTLLGLATTALFGVRYTPW